MCRTHAPSGVGRGYAGLGARLPLLALRVLGEVFCIDVCAYSVMVNRHHVALHLNPERAAALSDEEVLEQ